MSAVDLEKFGKTVDELGVATNMSTEQIVMIIDTILKSADDFKLEVDNTPLSDEEIELARKALEELL